MATRGEAGVPSFPEDYARPAVWRHDEGLGGTFGATNKPTAGAQKEMALPVGEHSYQLYSMGTPNGQKVTIMLEELYATRAVEYDAWMVDIFTGDQFGSGFVELNPNSKIPALADHAFDPPLRVFESGNILRHLSEQNGDAFVPADVRMRSECFNWLFFLQGSAPYFGQFGHFTRYAPVNIKYCVDRYTMETKRLLDVLDKQLDGAQWLVGDEYTIADMCTYPWIECLVNFYEKAEFLELESYANVTAWRARMAARPAVQRGMRVNAPFSDAGVRERHSAADLDV